MSQYANEDFLRNQQQNKTIEFSCLKLSFIITLSTAIGFGTAALIFYITVSSCANDISTIPNALEMTLSSTLGPEYDFSWTTEWLTQSTSHGQALITQETTTKASQSDQLKNKLSFQGVT